MDALRTPEARFENLPGFDFSPHYLSDLKGFEGVRAAYVDEGPVAAGQVFLCLHGQPTWSYLYRKMMPVFVGSGARVIAPDLLGFGRSDKPIEEELYGFDFHRNFLIALVERLDLHNITLVVQDWGGLIGLTLPVDPRIAQRVTRLIIMNTTLATGHPPSDGFMAWRAYSGARPDLAVGALMQRSTPQMSADEAAAYDAPFPDASFKAGVRAFPKRVMTDPGMEGVDISLAARTFWAEAWQGQSFMAWGAVDPVFGLDIMRDMQQLIRGCPEPMIIPEGGHFVQEWGQEIAEAALKSFEAGLGHAL
ncbi:haloalkane dehalogenase [Aquidulcibacter sp.]|uniref:haloalkane dehalogenase n=1 Tax=Aquidulcibacter sp. TaxID=2052990 RepID=UPI0025B931F9|nr:haloalkane dehalogenase [Aquidulcibacter sp.]MCA3696342.1 alpha/beta fold hydrolase [Aquidulcibacter sp.]